MLRRLFFAGLVITQFGFLVVAQEVLPPPPPLIWKAPDSSEVKRFLNSTHNFAVDFIGEPDVAENKGVLSNYIVRRKGSLMYVRVIHFTKDDLQKLTNQEIITKIKAAHGAYGNFKIVDVVSESVDAVEFSASDKFTFRRVKARIEKDKLYELYIDVTNWHILQDHYKDKVEAFNKEATRFFDSFVILK